MVKRIPRVPAELSCEAAIGQSVLLADQHGTRSGVSIWHAFDVLIVE